MAINRLERHNIERERQTIYLPDQTRQNDSTTKDYIADNMAFIKEQQERSKDVQEKLIEEEKPSKPKKKKRKTYPQDWPIYNIYQTREKAMCYRILSDAVDSLDIPPQLDKMGRPTVDLKEILKCLCVKIYNDVSARRLHSELIFYKGLGHINKIYHFNTILKYLSDPIVIPYLEQIYKILAKPMASIESCCAIDSTGFSTIGKPKWSTARLNFKEHKDYKKLHMTIGVRTNVIVSVRVTDGTDADCPLFKPLLEDTAKIFPMNEISADSGYLSRENCNVARDLGIEPYIMPKKNTISKSEGSPAWGKMVRLWNENEPLFRLHYHRRSNIESTNSSMKRILNDTLKGKTDMTQINEIMCRVVCHNLRILAECMLQFGVKPDF